MTQEDPTLTVNKEGEIVTLPVPIPSVARPLVSAEQGKADWDEYIALCNAILDTAQDYQTISGKRFKKKSAWRKLARAFRVTDRIVNYHIERDPLSRPIWASYMVEAEYPNGQIATGYHECHVRERCCPTAFGNHCPKSKYQDHSCCREGCDGWHGWSHPGDIPATAHTRAKNRAIADLIGAGEVTAEEIQDEAPPRAEGKPAAKKAAPRPPAKPPQKKPRKGPQQKLYDALVAAGKEQAVAFLRNNAGALIEEKDDGSIGVLWGLDTFDDDVATLLLERLQKITHPKEPPEGEREPESTPDLGPEGPAPNEELPFE